MSLFLEDIENKNYFENLDWQEKAQVERYLEEVKTGPADGEMDIEWQENGKGYYAHLHVIERLDENEKRKYLERLSEDISTWLSRHSNNYTVKNVKSILFG